MAGRYYPSRPAKMMGKMTISYGIAQILAPIITGYIAESGGGYRDGLIIACLFMMVGTILIGLMKRSESEQIRSTNEGKE